MKKNRLLKIVGFACLFVVLTISVNAQKYKSVFKNLTWEQAAEQAQKNRVRGCHAKSSNPGGSEETGCCRTEIVLNS